ALRIDETSDSYILIKVRLVNSTLGVMDHSTCVNISWCLVAKQRRVNGLMNRLSVETKDGILRDLKAIYAANSKNMTNNTLKDAIFAVCANESQVRCLRARFCLVFRLTVASLLIRTHTDDELIDPIVRGSCLCPPFC